MFDDRYPKVTNKVPVEYKAISVGRINSANFAAHGLKWKLRLDIPPFTRFLNPLPHISLWLPEQTLPWKVPYVIKFSFEIPAMQITTKTPVQELRQTRTGFGRQSFEGHCSRKQADTLARGCVDGNLSIKVTTQLIPQFDKLKLWMPASSLQADLLNTIKDDRFADLTFLVGPTRRAIRANRLFLENRVHVMKDILEDIEFDSNTMVLPDVDAEQFKAMLHYIYSDDRSFLEQYTEIHLKELLVLANQFGCWKLKVLIEKKMIEEDMVTYRSAIAMLLFADSYNCAMLKEVAMAIVSQYHPEKKICDDLMAGQLPATDKYAGWMISALYQELERQGIPIDSDASREVLLKQLRLAEKVYLLDGW